MRQTGSEQWRVPSKMILQYYFASPRFLEDHSIRAFTTAMPHSYISPTQRRLRELVTAATSPRAIQLKMDPVIILLHSSQRNIGKSTLARRAAGDLGIHMFDIDSYDLMDEGTGSSDMKTEAFLKARVVRTLASGAQLTSAYLTQRGVKCRPHGSCAQEDCARYQGPCCHHYRAAACGFATAFCPWKTLRQFLKFLKD